MDRASRHGKEVTLSSKKNEGPRRGATVAARIALGHARRCDHPDVQVPRATLVEKVKVNADRIKFPTTRATDVSVVTLTMAPGVRLGGTGILDL